MYLAAQVNASQAWSETGLMGLGFTESQFIATASNGRISAPNIQRTGINPNTGLPGAPVVADSWSTYANQVNSLQQAATQYRTTPEEAAKQAQAVQAMERPVVLKSAEPAWASINYCGVGCWQWLDAAGNVVAQVGG